MRHGAAEDRSHTGRDFDRVLTDEGRAQVRVAATRVRALRDEPLPRILSSPLARARETAEIVASIAGSPGTQFDVRDELAAAEGPLCGLVEQIQAAGRDALLVGHQPTIELVARRLATPHPDLVSGFRTALVLVLEHVADGPWRSLTVVDPRL
jgi:phosphohistidine phosphatase